MRFFSDSYERVTGQRGDQYVGRKLPGLRAAGMAQAAVFEQVMQTGKPTMIALNYPLGGKRTLVTAAPAFDSEGCCYAIIANVRDVDEIAHAEPVLPVYRRWSQFAGRLFDRAQHTRCPQAAKQPVNAMDTEHRKR